MRFNLLYRAILFPSRKIERRQSWLPPAINKFPLSNWLQLVHNTQVAPKTYNNLRLLRSLRAVLRVFSKRETRLTIKCINKYKYIETRLARLMKVVHWLLFCLYIYARECAAHMRVYLYWFVHAAATQVVPVWNRFTRDTKTQGAHAAFARNVMMIDVRWVIGTCNTLLYARALKLHTYVYKWMYVHALCLLPAECDLLVCVCQFFLHSCFYAVYINKYIKLVSGLLHLVLALEIQLLPARMHGSHHNVTKQDCQLVTLELDLSIWGSFFTF